jgi:hypothetical protein
LKNYAAAKLSVKTMAISKNNLTGVWHGLYSYPAYLEPVFFVASLISHGSSFSGTTHEAQTGAKGAPLKLFAALTGTLTGNTVDFLKTYDQSHSVEHSILYNGELNFDQSEIEGTWTIPGYWSGRFLMMRSAGMKEEIIRKAYEHV